MHELQTLYENAGPKIQEAFQEQMNKDMPKYAHSMEKEREAFLNTLKAQLETKLHGQYEQLLKEQQKTLETEFKDVDPEKNKRMMANINRAVERLVKKYYVDELESQFRQLYQTWDSFPAAEPLKPGDLYSAHLEMLRHKLAHTEGLAIK